MIVSRASPLLLHRSKLSQVKKKIRSLLPLLITFVSSTIHKKYFQMMHFRPGTNQLKRHDVQTNLLSIPVLKIEGIYVSIRIL